MKLQQLQEKLDRHLAYLEQDKNNARLQLTVGLLKAQILHHQQHVLEAIALLEKLILNHESSAEITGLLSLLYFDNLDASKAESFSKKALKLDPTNYEAQLVQLLLKAVQNKAELDEINALLDINPYDSRLWFVLGTTQMSHMNFHAAEHAFAQSIAIHPDFYNSWICSAWCNLLQNNLDKAETAYHKALKIDSESADGWAGLALVYALRNDVPEAQKKLQKSDMVDPECFLAAITRIIIANQTSPDEAAQRFNAAFPDVEPEINQILTQAILTASEVKKTFH